MFIEEIHRRYEKDLRRFARSLSRNESEAEDLVQETFLKALANCVLLKTFPEYKQKSWLFSVLKNMFTDRKRREKFEMPIDERCESIPYTGAVPDVDVREMIRHLPQKYREVVCLKYWAGMTSPQMARVLSIPPATARYRLHIAIGILKSIIISQEVDKNG